MADEEVIHGLPDPGDLEIGSGDLELLNDDWIMSSSWNLDDFISDDVLDDVVTDNHQPGSSTIRGAERADRNIDHADRVDPGHTREDVDQRHTGYDHGCTAKEAVGSSSPVSSLTQMSSPNADDGSGTEQCKSDEEAKCSPDKSSGSRSCTSEKKRTAKRKLSEQSEGDDGEADEEEVKRRARLMRNRESAQLSRQRKKAYVDDLEDRIRALNSTVAELNNTITMISAENVSLRSQLAYFYHHANGNGNGNTKKAAPVTFPSHVGMPMYPYPPGYAPMPMRPGATGPQVPIPRLKTVVTPAKSAKRAKVTKDDTRKTTTPASTTPSKSKKMGSSVAVLGVLCIVMLCTPFDWGTSSGNAGWTQTSPGYGGGTRVGGRVLMSTNDSGDSRVDDSKGAGGNGSVNGSVFPAIVNISGVCDINSDRFTASVVFPRDDTVVRLDGDLIVKAVMAGDRADRAATKEQQQRSKEVVPVNNLPALVSAFARERIIKYHRALPSSSSGAGDESHEMFEGSMFDSGVCSEVFEFALSSSEGREGVVPTTSTVQNQSSSGSESESESASGRKRSGHHRRNLAVPLPPPSKKQQNNTAFSSSGSRQTKSSMVVSIFADPKESSFEPVSKDPGQVFVVVLVNGIKYVTYSCMLPRAPRVVTG